MSKVSTWILQPVEVEAAEAPGPSRESESAEPSAPRTLPRAERHIDAGRLVLEGEEEVVIRCGEASITLTRSGKILLRGKYLLNSSEGVNRIVGGSVEIN